MPSSAPAFLTDDFSQSVTGSIPAKIPLESAQAGTVSYYATTNLRGASGATCPASPPTVVGHLVHGTTGAAIHATYLTQYDRSPSCNLYEVLLTPPAGPTSDTFTVTVNGTSVPSATRTFTWCTTDGSDPTCQLVQPY
jgi:hypothetical protein